jgi:hypothetical protein
MLISLRAESGFGCGIVIVIAVDGAKWRRASFIKRPALDSLVSEKGKTRLEVSRRFGVGSQSFPTSSPLS